MDNALTHGAGNVELIGQRNGDAVEIQVRDHGAGFADSYLAHPFERFAPTASTGRGTGLGLAIVQAITEAHGGAVSLGNDHGAAVTLSLCRSTQLDRLPHLVPARARQQRPLIKNGSGLRVEAPTAPISDQDRHRTAAQVVQREALEGLIAVA